jgi:hypothetical protein
MFFERLSRSWEYAKTSYWILWQHKQLIVFPILSTVAALIVTASFVAPLWMTGTIDTWTQQASAGDESTDVLAWVTLFLFYLSNYFVIIFFNAALVACTMRVIEGETPTVRYGLGMAGKRLGQIFAWAVVSAVVGVILRAIESAHEKAGEIISAILGTAWTALTYFVVPTIVLEGAGPVQAFKRSLSVLKETWGEALVGNFSLGLLGFLIALPVLIVVLVLGYLAVQSGSAAMLIAVIVLGVALLALVAAASAAADVIFKGLLYAYATGQTLPTETMDVDLGGAFTQRPGK